MRRGRQGPPVHRARALVMGAVARRRTPRTRRCGRAGDKGGRCGSDGRWCHRTVHQATVVCDPWRGRSLYSRGVCAVTAPCHIHSGGHVACAYIISRCSRGSGNTTLHSSATIAGCKWYERLTAGTPCHGATHVHMTSTYYKASTRHVLYINDQLYHTNTREIYI